MYRPIRTGFTVERLDEHDYVIAYVHYRLGYQHTDDHYASKEHALRGIARLFENDVKSRVIALNNRIETIERLKEQHKDTLEALQEIPDNGQLEDG